MVGRNLLYNLERNLFFGMAYGLTVGSLGVVRLLISCGGHAAYHYAIRRIKRDEQEIVKERFVEAILINYERDF